MEIQQIKPFDGRPENYSVFRVELIGAARQASAGPQGLLPHLLSAEEFLKITEESIDLYPPRSRPLLEPARTNYVKASTYKSEFDVWDKQMKRYAEDLANINKVKLLFYNSIDLASQTMLKGSGSIMNVKLSQMLTIMDNNYNIITPAAYERGVKALYAVFDPAMTNMRQYIGEHINAHTFILDNTGEPMAKVEKLRLLRKAVENCNDGGYQTAVNEYDRKEKSVKDQSFEKLSELLIQVDESKPRALTSQTTQSLGYVAEMQETATSKYSNDDVERFCAAITKSLSKNIKSPTPPKKKNTFYCFTHGIDCNHTSAECFHPAAGHRTDATAGNKMGGAETKFSSKYSKKR
jgi:hypothetical protein